MAAGKLAKCLTADVQAFETRVGDFSPDLVLLICVITNQTFTSD